jgi:hypothetical protein
MAGKCKKPAVFIKKNDYIGMKADEKRTINDADALLADAIALREKSERQREEVRRLREDARRKAEGKK